MRGVATLEESEGRRKGRVVRRENNENNEEEKKGRKQINCESAENRNPPIKK